MEKSKTIKVKVCDVCKTESTLWDCFLCGANLCKEHYIYIKVGRDGWNRHICPAHINSEILKKLKEG